MKSSAVRSMKDGKRGLALQQLIGRLHQDGGATRSKEEYVFGARFKAIGNHLIEPSGKTGSAGLDAQVSFFIEIQHGKLTVVETTAHPRSFDPAMAGKL